MATKNHNLSDYNPDIIPSAEILKSQRFGIIVADWNSDITYALLDGAHSTLLKHGVSDEHIEIVHVPGTFELTHAAALLLNDQGTLHGLDAVIILGCVIQGDTPHFDYVCQGVTQGAAILNAQGRKPVIFGVLTTGNKQQAIDRAGGVLGNKGIEAAYTAIKMANIFAI